MNVGLLSKKFWKLQRGQGKVPKEVCKLMIGSYDREIAEDHRTQKEEAKVRRQARYDERAARAKRHDEEYMALLEPIEEPAVPNEALIKDVAI
jgi:hypothetical protein